MTVIRHLEQLTPAQRKDLDAMVVRMHKRCEEVRMAATEAKRREAGEWILRVAAEIYSWSK